MSQDKKEGRGCLQLEDGTVYEGMLFGNASGCDGEVVFNTGMVGYVESVTDPSYRGQVLAFTYPLIGNYGVPEVDRFESDMIQVRGAVVSSLAERYSHWEGKRSLHKWFEENDIPGISGIDTRALTKRLRQKGTMLGRIVPMEESECPFDVEDPNASDLVSEVSGKEIITMEGTGPRVLLIDCGYKMSIIRELEKRECSVTRIPHDHDLTGIEYDGILISNGPGDPMMCKDTITNISRLVRSSDPPPIAGICLGNQILALSAGASTFKLPFGHRSQNQPCIEERTGHCVITSQNHGFAVDGKTLPDDWEVWYRNLNDGSVEGIRHKDLPFMAVQFHPEANPGPTDPRGFFDSFMGVMRHGK